MSVHRLLLVASFLAACAPLYGQQTGYVKAKVNPGRAGVFIDGKYVGPAANFRIARKYAVAPGEHQIKLVEPRYQEFTTKVTVQAGKTATVRQALKAVAPAKPPFGTLRTVNTDKFAAVYVNGKYFGHVDESNNASQGILLNPGDYDVRIEPVSGGKAVRQKVKIEAGKTVIVK